MNNSHLRAHQQYKYYVFLSVFYAVLMITAQATAFRMIQIGPFLEPGGIFIFPATFAISDVISEVYGPTLARRTIYCSLFAQAFFSSVPTLVNQLPSPPHWHHAQAYHLVFGSSWLIFLSNVTAVLVGMLLNTQIIAKTKILTRGRFFSARSIISSASGELILTAIIVSIALLPVVGLHTGAKLFVNMYLFKLGFSILAIFPASLLVVVLKKLDQADVYEEKITLNPLSQFIGKNTTRSNVVNLCPQHEPQSN